ncbi:putative hydrolase of the HAD superfamily [Micromonospora pattaloongensis]|uniref:Putative hydrolase of the HAD superfamily n=1 Tax=Micromonospora pattaloongensis TaxID=405436 RepID=A0A1H3GQ95_9ACTN|nr:HAD family hydrolase [Micromonospora pattaloongensis]SDY05287.1 putative hydrolase of the HAD superfamily [Micromonospora pattaloongensis]
MPSYRAVLFDFFGTLTRAVTRGPTHVEIARMLGCDPGAVVEVLDRSFHARARGRYGSAEQTLGWIARQAGASPSAEALAAAAAARVEALRADTALRPDAVATLRGLRRRGLRTAVVSDCTHELPVLLPALPVAPLLDAQVYSIEVGHCKPDPAIYLEACARLGVPPERCLYVGDGGSRELTGAAAVGMTPVRLTAPDLADHLVFDPDAEWRGAAVATLSETVELVDRFPALV